MIIDSHTHIGNSNWGDFSPEYLLEIIQEVDYAICSNLNGIDAAFPESFKRELDCNLEMIDITRKYPKLKPLAVCQPNISQDSNTMRNLLEKYPDFIGLKIHPEYMRLPADNEKYDKYLEIAREFKKPCLYHSGHIKSRFSSPVLIYKKAQKFPDVPIILGHLSTGPKECHQKAIEILLDSIENEKANLYVDISWIDFAFERINESLDDTLMLIKSLRSTKKGNQTFRILWGSDAPVGAFNHTRKSYNYNLEIFKNRVLEYFEDEKLLENLLSNNARKLYGF